VIALLLMIAGAVTVVAGFVWIWPPLAVIAAGTFLLTAGVDLANRSGRHGGTP
jgi:hypothetical protein